MGSAVLAEAKKRAVRCNEPGLFGKKLHSLKPNDIGIADEDSWQNVWHYLGK